MRKFLMLLISALCLNCLFVVNSQSIRINGNLAYVKSGVNGYELVQQNGSDRQVIALDPQICTALSPSVIYSAESSFVQNEGNLTIRDLQNGQTIIQIPWSNDWEICTMNWLTDEIFSVRQVGTVSEFFEFEIEGTSIVPTNYQSTPNSPPPSLPDYVPTINANFLLPSPNNNLYVYERCAGQTVTTYDCQSPTELVVYDAVQNIPLAVLENPDMTIIRGYNATNPSRIRTSYGQASWSHDGRYFMYRRRITSPFDLFDLVIFDTQTGQYLDTDWINVQIDSNLPILWSPTSQKLEFWILGRIGEPLDGDNPDTLRTLVFFDALTGEFQMANNAFDIRGEATDGTWSPDSLGFVFIDLNNDLVLVEPNMGTTSILDSDVQDILVWRTNIEVDILSIDDLTFFNADTATDIRILSTTSTETIDIANNLISIRADTDPAIVGSVVFWVDGNVVATDNSAPYTIAGESGSDILPWNIALGEHTIVATPHSGADGTGDAGTPFTVQLNIVDSSD